jgi:hypothetical protein
VAHYQPKNAVSQEGGGGGGGGINTVISSAKEDSYKEMGEPIPEIDNPEYPLIF